MPYVSIPGENLWYELIIKLHSRCNFNCDYCYVYNLADQSWRDKPKVMSRKTIDIVALRIAAYMREYRIQKMRIILHGGEPLLAGVELIDYTIRTIRRAVPPGGEVAFSIQTNGSLITREVLEVMLQHNVRVGISLDGDAYANRHRLFHNGASTYNAVVQALQLLDEPRYRPLNGGLLCVIDLQNDPIAVYKHLRSFNPSGMDFLLPLGHWSKRPKKNPRGSETPYADWLIKIFDAWRSDKPIIEIRYFMQIMEFIACTSMHLKDFKPQPVPWFRRVEVIGPWTVGAGVIEVDGSYELLDAFKSIRQGEAATQLNVYDHHLTQALVQALKMIEQRKIHELSATCQACQVVEVCGAGFYVHRYNEKAEHPYLNPSVYCADLKKLILHIARSMRQELVQIAGRAK